MVASALSNRQNCACARKTLQTQRGWTHGAGCVRQWFRTAEPLGERRYENWNTQTHVYLFFFYSKLRCSFLDTGRTFLLHQTAHTLTYTDHSAHYIYSGRFGSFRFSLKIESAEAGAGAMSSNTTTHEQTRLNEPVIFILLTSFLLLEDIISELQPLLDISDWKF